MSDDDGAKKTCENTGACCFGFIFDVLVCPFVSCYKCGKCCCNKCCCKKKEYSQPPQNRV